nr:hypothetical protein [Microbispora sp. GKU 823]
MASTTPRGRLAVHIVDDHRRPGRRQRLGIRPAEPAARTGDNGHLAGKIHEIPPELYGWMMQKYVTYMTIVKVLPNVCAR